jgi:hypothetical protein
MTDELLIPTGEAALDPGLPICDAHHHLWERRNDRYLLEAFIDDTRNGHHIASTVSVECRAMYHREGPKELKPLGETEFLDRVPARALSDPNIKTSVAAGIVGHADLTLEMRWQPYSRVI